MSNSKGIAEDIRKIRRALEIRKSAGWKGPNDDDLLTLLEENERLKGTPLAISHHVLAKQNLDLLKENERITKENVALNSRSELMDKHLQQYREERDSWINAAERLGRKRQQLREELEQIANYQRDQDESPLHAYDECKRIARSILDQYKS